RCWYLPPVRRYACMQFHHPFGLYWLTISMHDTTCPFRQKSSSFTQKMQSTAGIETNAQGKRISICRNNPEKHDKRTINPPQTRQQTKPKATQARTSSTVRIQPLGELLSPPVLLPVAEVFPTFVWFEWKFWKDAWCKMTPLAARTLPAETISQPNQPKPWLTAFSRAHPSLSHPSTYSPRRRCQQRRNPKDILALNKFVTFPQRKMHRYARPPTILTDPPPPPYSRPLATQQRPSTSTPELWQCARVRRSSPEGSLPSGRERERYPLFGGTQLRLVWYARNPPGAQGRWTHCAQRKRRGRNDPVFQTAAAAAALTRHDDGVPRYTWACGHPARTST
ncbi:unnamed protein product, partial [Ectocarpus sp. 12 AP-2014]